MTEEKTWVGIDVSKEVLDISRVAARSDLATTQQRRWRSIAD